MKNEKSKTKMKTTKEGRKEGKFKGKSIKGVDFGKVAETKTHVKNKINISSSDKLI